LGNAIELKGTRVFIGAFVFNGFHALTVRKNHHISASIYCCLAVITIGRGGFGAFV